jgi:hypothetical protein
MICEECKKRNVEKILKEADKAMSRYTKKLIEEKKCRIQANKKAIDLKEK